LLLLLLQGLGAGQLPTVLPRNSLAQQQQMQQHLPELASVPVAVCSSGPRHQLSPSAAAAAPAAVDLSQQGLVAGQVQQQQQLQQLGTRKLVASFV
jgi:hypothetical protein